MTQPAKNLAAVPVRPRRRRRWLLRIPIILIATVVTIAILTQLFLWTDYPRKIAQAQVERILHVRTSIKSVKIGWLGHTHIEGVELTLPMEREPFLHIDQIDATHASLPLIAFDQEVSDVVINGVALTARQDAAGRWNVQQLIGGPGKPTTSPATTERPSNPIASLPAIHASDVRASLIRADGKRLDLPAAKAELSKPDSLIATLNASVGDVLNVNGELGQTASLPQSLRLRFTHVPADITAFFGVGKPPTVSADVEWQGRLAGGGVSGSLNALDVQAQGVRAVGRMNVDVADSGAISVRPANLHITAGENAAVDLFATAGQLRFDKTLFLEGLAGTVDGGRFVVNGTFDPATLGTDVAANWEQVAHGGVASTGSTHIRTLKLFNGNVKLDVEVRGGARTPQGDGIGAVAISGEGSLSGDAFSGIVKFDPFTWTPSRGGGAIVTPRLEGDVSLAGTAVRFDAHAAGDPRAKSLTLSGGGDRVAQTWWATFDASALRMPELEAKGVKGPVDINLAASGTGPAIRIEKAFLKLEKGSAFVSGTANLSGNQPINLAAWAWYEKPVTEDEAAQLNSLRMTSTITGTLAPRDLKADVDLAGSELVFAHRLVGDVALHVTGAVTENEASVQSQELEAFGGHWSLRGSWAADASAPPTVVVKFRDIPMANLGALANRDDLAGQIETGEATLRIRSSRLDQIDMVAQAHGSALAAGLVRAESLDLTATLKAGRFDVKPTFRESGGTLGAEVQGDVTLATPVRAAIALENWPSPYFISTLAGAERFRPRASGKANAEVSLRTGAVSGDMAMAGAIERGDTKLADFRLDAELRDKQITLHRATIGTLDGTLAANGKFDLGNYNATVFNATFDKLTPAQLAWSNPILGELKGELNGTVAIRPSVAPRALGPLELELNVRPDAMSFRGVRIGDLDVLAYANVGAGSQFRVVTDRAVLNVAGGRLETFARVSDEPGRGLAQLITANFRGLDLGELVKAADNDGKDLVGKIGGRVQIFGQTTNLKTLTGDAAIDIADSDLVNFGPIAALYDVLSVGTAGSQPIGTGSVTLRFGADDLTIEDANYFNRGVYASAFGSIRGLSNGTAAEVDHALVVGSLQPLRAVKLPFFGDVNDTLAALQSAVTAIEVTGTMKEPKMQQVAIGAVSDAFQKLLLGKARGAK